MVNRDAAAASATQTAAARVRVTHVVFDLNGGGLESLIASMARHSAGTSVALSAISLSGRAGRVGAATAPLFDEFRVLRPWPVVSMLLPVGLALAIRRTRADIVHLHSGCWYKGAVAARLAGVAGVVYTEHGREHHDPALMRALDRLASRRTDAVVAVSDRLASYMAQVVGVEPRRIRTIRNGVDTAAFAPGPPARDLRRSLGIPDGALVVGSVGRLEPVKAYERLIRAVARVRTMDIGAPVFVVIWGDGSERDALAELASSHGLAGAVKLPGWTDTPVVAHQLVDAFALTSRSEGMSVSLLESLACGVAPVVMDVGANAEILGPDLAGQVVPAGDEDAFVTVLAATLRDSARRRRAGASGRARVVAQFSFASMMHGYAQLYRELVARREGARTGASL
jgi:glycosyltransferase involved in cell wall biosynthesis